jgi:hypothetical protein
MYIFELCMIVKLWIGYFRIKQNKKQHNHRFLNKIVLVKRRLYLDKSISFLQMKKESSMTNELLIFSRQTCMWSVRTSLASRSTQSTTIIVWQCQRILRLAVAEHQKKTCMAAPSVARALRRRRRQAPAPRSAARARTKRTLAFRSSSYYWLPPCNFVQYTNSPFL